MCVVCFAPLMYALLCVSAIAVARAARAVGRTRMRDATLPSSYSFGSGAFGLWQPDEFGAPFYNYSLDQLTDARATYAELSPVDAFARLPSDHLFHIGNDRLVALASNYGSLRVRTDEGGPKLLQDLHPPDNTYGGGFGYLVANNETLLLSSFFNRTGATDACAATSTRAFGLGYMRVSASAGCAAGGGPRADVVHDVIVPHGRDAVVVVIVNITNAGDEVTDFSWTEIFGSRFYHLDLYSRQLLETYNATAGSGGGGTGPTSYLSNFRAFVDDHYAPAFNATPGGAHPGVQVAHAWRGLSAGDVVEMARVDAALRQAAATNAFIGPMQPRAPPAGGSLWDESPPLAGLFDTTPAGGGGTELGSNCGAFFGRGGSRAPDGALRPLAFAAAGLSEGAGCLSVRRHVRALAPGATATLSFVWAYATPRAPAPAPAALAAAYAPRAVDGFSLRAATVRAALADAVKFDAPGAPPWLAREVLWHSYNTHAALTFDDYFNETILDQGTDYRYGGGFQGAARDPLQHLLPLLYTRPAAARSIIIYTLKEFQAPSTLVHGPPYFLIPYGVIQHGFVAPWGLRPSDLELFLLLAVGEYVLATGDAGLLAEVVTTYDGEWTGAVGDLLAHAFEYRTHTIGLGEHGLLRVQGSDWSDSFCDKVAGCVFNNSVFQDIYERGESLLNSAIASYALPRFAAALRFAGAPWAALAPAADAFAAGQAAALRQHGAASGGPWLRRAWLPSVGWQQDAVLEITQQPWHVLGGVFNASFNDALAAAVKRNLSLPSPIGPAIMGVPFPNDHGGAAGYGENGGVWAGSLNMPWVWALAERINSTEAWQEFLLGTSANNADVYGDRIWAGVWSASDVVNSFLHVIPGQPSWPRFPVLCTHRHAWPLWALTKLAGVAFDERGAALAPPPLPAALRCGGGRAAVDAALVWSLDTPRFRVTAFANGSWAGIFASWGAGAPVGRAFRLRARLPIQRACGRGGGGVSAALPPAWEARLARAAAAADLEAPTAEEVAHWGADAGSVLAVLAVDVEAPADGDLAWAVAPRP